VGGLEKKTCQGVNKKVDLPQIQKEKEVTFFFKKGGKSTLWKT